MYFNQTQTTSVGHEARLARRNTGEVVIAIEGLPGAGKTTSARALARKLGIPALIETTADHPFLESVYDDADRHDLETELAFLLLHFHGYRTRARQHGIVISDFSPAKDHLFARDMLTAQDLEVFETVYAQLYRDESLPALALYLDVPPEECLRRIRGRGREFEAGLELDRLVRMRQLYVAHLATLADRVVEVVIGPEDTPDEVVARLSDTLTSERMIPQGA